LEAGSFGATAKKQASFDGNPGFVGVVRPEVATAGALNFDAGTRPDAWIRLT
jgi:hypothetical protein